MTSTAAEGPAALVLAGVWITRDGHPVLEDISFAVPPGAFAGICGPNGAGKTTLLKAILGVLPVERGSIRVLGRAPGQAAQGGVGYVPQRNAIPANFPATVLDVVRLGHLHIPGDDRTAAFSSLEQVGIASLAERAVGQLSGGQ